MASIISGEGVKYFSRVVVLLTLLLLMTSSVFADRIKNLTSIEGVRQNQLLGYGLVVGLTNTGDRNIYTDQSLRSLLNKYSIYVPSGENLNASNVAAVMVEASLPPFAKPGQTIDVTVSSIGNARSLRNGTLITTQLLGANGRVYGVAQGNLIVSGAEAKGLDGSSIHINSTNVGIIPNGATVERSISTGFNQKPCITFDLLKSSFTTSERIAKAINKKFGVGTAKPIDSASVRVYFPFHITNRVQFVSKINHLDVTPSKPEAKVVVNSRTGTVIMTEDVRVLPVAISEGDIVVNVSETQTASQPSPFSSSGETRVLTNSQIKIRKSQTTLKVLNTGPSLNQIVKALNDVGATPRDLVEVLELLKKAGALKARLIVM